MSKWQRQNVVDEQGNRAILITEQAKTKPYRSFHMKFQMLMLKVFAGLGLFLVAIKMLGGLF